MQQVRREVTLAPGPVVVRGNLSSRNKKKRKFADYVLSLKPGLPLAIVEAKDNNHSISSGLQQALDATQLAAVRGRSIILAARVKPATGGAASAGSIAIDSDGTGSLGFKPSFYFNPGDGAGAYRDIYVTSYHVPADASYVHVRLYGAGDATASTANFHSAHLAFGDDRPLFLMH